MKQNHPSQIKPHMPVDSSQTFFRDVNIEFLVHELKDPVAIIETGARTLLERQETFGQLSQRQERTLKRVLRNARKARSMMYHLLEIGRSESGCLHCQRFDPVPAVLGSLSEALETTGRYVDGNVLRHGQITQWVEHLIQFKVFLEIAPDSGSLILYQDEVKFKQITANLFKNALYHRKASIHVRLHHDAGNLWVDVADDGPGVAPEHHQRIFERYTQLQECSLTSRKGHGLGLAGARILARCLGGDIDLNCPPGQGAIFRLKLPLTFEVR